MDTPEQNKLSEQDVQRIFNESAQREAEAYALFSERYAREFPMPEKAAIKLMNAIGWQFISIVIQSIFAIVLAALRTADMFFDASAGSVVQLQWAEAISAIGAIELGIVIFATIKSEAENRKTQLEDLKSALNIDVRLLRTGIIACVAISIIAGLGVSFKGFGIELGWFTWIVAIVMGVGASLVAWVSGDILGAMLARWNNAISLANLLYSEELEKREEKKRGMWEAAPERQIARSQLQELKEWQAANRFRAERVPRAKKEVPAPEPAPKPKTGTRSNEIRMKIYAHLDKVSFEEQRVPGPSELMRELGVAKSYASGVRTDWLALHPEFLTSETAEADSEA
jgi:hypothetical protein